MTAQDQPQALPSLYLPHGGGPCFFMEWTAGPADTWHRMADWLGHLGATFEPAPKAILVVSAHWEEEAFLATSNPKPALIYDYYGFPEDTYRLTYPAPGAPALAARARDLLVASGLPAGLEPERGLDHGVFIPLKVIWPNADLPVVQLSLRTGLDPAAHIAAGRALQPLRQEGVLILGSGMSFHNMRAFFQGGFEQASKRFDAWLSEAVAMPDAARREDALCHWEAAPAARQAHPRAEHLLPLMVAAGAGGGEPGRKIFEDFVMNAIVSAFAFGTGVGSGAR